MMRRTIGLLIALVVTMLTSVTVSGAYQYQYQDPELYRWPKVGYGIVVDVQGDIVFVSGSVDQPTQITVNAEDEFRVYPGAQPNYDGLYAIGPVVQWWVTPGAFARSVLVGCDRAVQVDIGLPVPWGPKGYSGRCPTPTVPATSTATPTGTATSLPTVPPPTPTTSPTPSMTATLPLITRTPTTGPTVTPSPTVTRETPSPTATAIPTGTPVVTPTRPIEVCRQSYVSVAVYGGWDGLEVQAWVGGTEQPGQKTAKDAVGEEAVQWIFWPPTDGSRWSVRVEPRLPVGFDTQRWGFRLIRIESPTERWVDNSPVKPEVNIVVCNRYIVYFQLVDLGSVSSQLSLSVWGDPQARVAYTGTVAAAVEVPWGSWELSHPQASAGTVANVDRGVRWETARSGKLDFEVGGQPADGKLIATAKLASGQILTATAEVKTSMWGSDWTRRGDVPRTAIGGVYTVESGDTLLDVAISFGSSVHALVKANSLGNPNYLTIGQKLVVPKAT